MPSPGYLTTGQTGKLLGMSTAQVVGLIKNGILAGRHDPDAKGPVKRWEIAREEVEKYLRSVDHRLQTGGGDDSDSSSDSGGGEVDEFDQMMASLGESSREIKVEVERVLPDDDPDRVGFLRDFSHAITTADLKRHFGGGTYRIRVIDGKTSKIYTKVIAGDPKFEDDDEDDYYDPRRPRANGSRYRRTHEGPRWRRPPHRGGYSRHSSRYDPEPEPTSETGVLLKTLQSTQEKQTSSLSEMMIASQNKMDQFFQSQMALLKEERKEREEAYKRDMAERELAHKREMERMREQAMIDREIEKERIREERQRHEKWLEAQRARDREHMELITNTLAGQSSLQKEYQAKTEKYFESVIDYSNKLLQNREQSLEREAAEKRAHLSQIEEMIQSQKDGDKAGLAETIVNGVTRTAETIASKIGPGQGQQHTMPGRNSGIDQPVLGHLPSPSGGGATLGSVSLPVLPQSPDGGAVNGPHPQNPQSPVTGDPQSVQNQGAASPMSLYAQFKNPTVAEAFQLAARHVTMGIEPRFLCDGILNIAEHDPTGMLLVSWLAATTTPEVCTLLGELLDEETKTILTSDAGQKWFDRFKMMLVASFSEDDSHPEDSGEQDAAAPNASGQTSPTAAASPANPSSGAPG